MNKPSIIAALLKCDRHARINGTDWWLAGTQKEGRDAFHLCFESAPVHVVEFGGSARSDSDVAELRIRSTPQTTWRIEDGAVVIEGAES